MKIRDFSMEVWQGLKAHTLFFLSGLRVQFKSGRRQMRTARGMKRRMIHGARVHLDALMASAAWAQVLAHRTLHAAHTLALCSTCCSPLTPRNHHQTVPSDSFRWDPFQATLPANTSHLVCQFPSLVEILEHSKKK